MKRRPPPASWWWNGPRNIAVVAVASVAPGSHRPAALSWITHAGFLLEDADAKSYDAISESLGFQLVRLSATWRTAPVGPPRLLSLMAIVLGDLTIADHERQLADAERLLASELTRQILPDGGHISRNPALLVELLLDLLPLSQCFVARNRPVPNEMSAAIRRALGMLRYMRMGDGSLARFNGTGLADPAHIATVLAYGAGTGKAQYGRCTAHRIFTVSGWPYACHLRCRRRPAAGIRRNRACRLPVVRAEPRPLPHLRQWRCASRP